MFDLHTLFGNSVLDFFWKNVSSPVHWGFANFDIISWKNTKNIKKAPKINILTKSHWRKTFAFSPKLLEEKYVDFTVCFLTCWFFMLKLHWTGVSTQIFGRNTTVDRAPLFTSYLQAEFESWNNSVRFLTLFRNPWKCCNFPQPFLHWK